jgi:hypothetical protein
MPRINQVLNNFPEQQAIISRLVLGYGEIELSLVSLVRESFGTDVDTAVRILFRARSESQRIEIADALVRPRMVQLKLQGQYSQALGALRHCKEIRNQYAHCIWQGSEHGLAFASLEEPAQSAGGVSMLKFKAITVALLKEQEKYLYYADDWLFWLMKEARFRRDRRRTHKISPPKALPPPKKHNRTS